MLIYPPYIYLLVQCKLDVELTAVKDKVTGPLGGSATLQWNINKTDENAVFQTLNLILLRDPPETLYNLNPTKQTPAIVEATKLFADRIKAEIKGGNTYLLELKMLNYSDENLFQLVIGISRGDETSNLKRKNITLIVEGMRHIIICYS